MAETTSSPNHVFDLPQTYQKPSASSLFNALDLLQAEPPSFDSDQSTRKPQISFEGVPKYLTSIIASDLHWLEEGEREALWDLASRRLAERSGRTGMSSFKRKFTIPTLKSSVDIQLQEPAMTGDNLGFKTWASSYVLAKRLHEISLPISTTDQFDTASEKLAVIELGAGTGLVGLAAALIWGARVMLTDLPEIEPNLSANIGINHSLLENRGTQAFSGVLDWTKPDVLNMSSSNDTVAPILSLGDALIVLAADPIYSTDHPVWLAQTVITWLKRDHDARFILAYPVRKAYEDHIEHLRSLLHEQGLVILYEQTEVGRDDWADDVTVSWSIWSWDHLPT